MAQQCRQRGEAGRIPGAADAREHVERLGCHARGEERVEREPERGVAHASASAGASVGEGQGKEVLGGGGEERREEDRGEGAERGRRRREAGGGGEARAASGVEEGEPEDGGRLTS